MRNKAILGDCLEVMPSLESASFDLILCDLPYGTTQCKWDSIIPLDKLWPKYERLIKNRGLIILFAGEPFTSLLISSNLPLFKYRITWDKMAGSGFLNSKKRPLTRVEDICVFSKQNLGNSTYNPILTERPLKNQRPIGNRNAIKSSTYGVTNGLYSKDYDNTKNFPTDLLSIASRQKECNSLHRVHPTQKPLELIEYLVKTFSNEGDKVLDNCAGSFTTAEACLNLNRSYVCIEKEEKYYKQGLERIQKTILKDLY